MAIRREPHWFGLSVFGLALLAVIGQAAARPSPDVAWNLYVARALLGGGRLGVDLFENTPPMIFALKVPAVALAGALGLREWSVWIAVVAILACAAAFLALHLSREWRIAQGGGAVATVAALVAALVLIPNGDFGQRDHVTAILVIPYVFLVARRWGGTAVSAQLAILVGALAGVGIGIKPHFVLLPAALLVLSARRIGIRGVFTPEHLAIGAVGIAYIAGVVAFFPEYLSYAAAYGPLYQHFQTDFFVAGGWVPSLPSWPSAAMSMGAVPAYISLGVFAAARGHLTRDERRLADVLATATGALLLVGVAQGKGWWYHFLPSQTFAVLTVVLVLTHSVGRSPRLLARVYLGVGAGMLAAVAASMAPAFVLRVVHPRDARLDADANLGRLLPLVRAAGPLGYVAVLSTNIASSFPLTLEGGSRWALRHPNLWPLVAFYPDEVREAGVVSSRPFAMRSPFEQQFTKGVVDDLIRTKPDLLLVFRSDPTVWEWGGARRFDYLAYFSDSPGFQDQVLAHYRQGTVVGDYDVYWRQGFRAATEPAPGVLSLTHIPLLSLASWTKLLSGVAFVVGFLGAWVASRPERQVILA